MYESLLNELISKFKKAENLENANYMSDYMKGQFDFYGIKAPIRKELSKAFFRQARDAQKVVPTSLILNMWDLPQREFQLAAVDLLRKYAKYAPDSHIDLYEQLVSTKSWWDTVDMLASNVIGVHFKQHPSQLLPYSQKWCKSTNFWLQRSAILFQLKYKSATNWELLQSLILPHIHSKEFFLQKAIGWALREYSKTNPVAVTQFVEKHPLAPLSHREAVRLIKN